MILYPAIDLKDGRCVRLSQGRFEAETIFNEDPQAQAQLFQTAGFRWLHVIDLDGALAGKPMNAGAVARILQVANVPVQIGGGVRTLGSLGYWIDAGATRVILGTVAVTDPALVRTAAREYPERVAVSIDVRDGKVAVAGWIEESECAAIDIAKRFEDAGVAALIVTDITRDGRKEGVNLDLVGEVADAVTIPVIAAGGLKDVGDIHALKARPGRPIQGAVLGRALYDGDVNPMAALAAASG